VICEAGFRCTSIVTDACCPSTATGAKCALPRTHLIGILHYPSLQSRKDTTQTHAWTNTSTRNAAQLSIQASMSRRVSGCRNTPVAQTQRTRANATYSQVQHHTHEPQSASTCRDSHANAGAPCGHTRTRIHAVVPAARALRSCARRRMAWQLQLSISTMLAMAHILLTTRDTSVTTTVRKRAAHAICVRLRMRTPAESLTHAKYRRMHAACLR